METLRNPVGIESKPPSLDDIPLQKNNRDEKIPTEKRKFKCELCDSMYTRKFVLSQHIRRVHKKELPHRCDLCPYAAVIKSELTQHKRRHGIYDRVYPCRYCKDVFRIPRLRKVHETIHIRKTYTCSQCHKVFREENDYKIHLGTHSNVGCRFCDRSFRTVEILKGHEKSHFKNGDSSEGLVGTSLKKEPQAIEFSRELNIIKTCTLCNISVHSLNELKRHAMKDHTHLFKRDDPYKWNEKGECPLCAKIVKTKSERVIHMLSHIGVLLYKCHLCEYKCNWIKNLKVHFQKHLNTNRIWKCHICNKICARKCQYTYHLMRIHGHRRSDSNCFLCEICGKEFTQKYRLDKHKVKVHRLDELSANGRRKAKRPIHEESILYDCPTCKLRFEYRESFYKHVKLHKEKHIFNLCGILLSDKRGLDKHAKCHPSLRCVTCDSIFDSPLHMQKHQKLCTMQRACCYCDRVELVQHGDFLSAHLRQNHSSKCLRCDVCTRVFCSFKLFDDHLVSHAIQAFDPGYSIYNPTHDSEDEDILGIWEGARRPPVLSYECSICGDILCSCQALVEHELKHRIPKFPILGTGKPSVPSLRRTTIKPLWKKVKMIRIFVLEGKTTQIEAASIPSEDRYVYFKDSLPVSVVYATRKGRDDGSKIESGSRNIGRQSSFAAESHFDGSLEIGTF